jgi:hypothetical protein
VEDLRNEGIGVPLKVQEARRGIRSLSGLISSDLVFALLPLPPSLFAKEHPRVTEVSGR